MNAAAPPHRPIRWFEYLIALVPFVLAFTGFIGLAIGPAACALNLAIMQSRKPRAVKVAAALGIALAAVVVWACAVRLMI
jgi:hypothetical protein